MKEVQAVIEKKIPERDLTIKARVNHNCDIAVSAKLPVWGLEKMATVIHGMSISNTLKSNRKVTLGWQLDLNI